MHPLIQDWMKLRISSESRQAYAIEATLVLSYFIKSQVFHEMTFDARQTTFSHLQAVMQNSQEYSSQRGCAKDTTVLNAISYLAFFVYNLGRYKVAEELFRDVFEGKKGLLDKEHPDTLTSINSFAFLLDSQGKHDEAEPVNRETIALTEKALSKEHLDTLTSMNNLASLLTQRGKHDEAEPIFRHTLALTEKVLGKEHPSTLISINSLTVLLKNQGKYNKAEPVF